MQYLQIQLAQDSSKGKPKVPPRQAKITLRKAKKTKKEFCRGLPVGGTKKVFCCREGESTRSCDGVV